MTDALWQLGGWTMLHFLWAGTIEAIIGGLVRLACRRAAPSLRYAISLTTLAALAALPIVIAASLSLHRPAILAGRAAAISSELEMPEAPSQDGSAMNAPAAPRVIDLATVEPSGLDEPIGAPSQPPANASSDLVANPSPSPSLRGRGIRTANFVSYLPYAWLVGAPLTFALLATGLVGSERLRRRSSLLTAGPAFKACERLRLAMRIARRVSVAACEGLAQPVLVGVVRPLILLPASALSGWTPEELEMVLVHELAHVRRWDNLVNLLQRIVESLLFFHPAVWLVSRQVRRDREECCDAVVVSRTAQPQRYAELLLSIAAVLPRGQAPRLAAASAMADHPLAGRIRRILKLEDEPMWITRRTLLATLAVPLILAAAGAYTVSAGDENAPIQNQANEGNVEPAHDSPERPQSARPGVVDVADGDPVSSHGPALNPEFRSRLLAGDGNPLRTYTYEAPPNLRDKINTRFEGILESADKDGVKVELTWQWQGDNRLEITAPDAAQQTLVADTEAGSTLPGLKLISTAGYARSNYIDPAVESPRLQAEIRRLHSLINEENKNLANIEVFKQLALRNARSPEEIEKAIDAALNVDGKIVEDQQRIASLQSAIEKLKPDGRGPAIATLEKELKAVEREAETYREKRRAEIRQQFARMPNDALRAAIIEYQIRRKAGTENLRKYEQELEKAEQELAELTQTAANGSNPTVAEEEIILRSYPTLDRDKVNLREWFKVIGSNERVQVKWFEKNNSIVVSAPQSIHAQLAELLEQARAGRGVGAESGRLVVQSPPHVRAPEMNIYLPPRISEWKPPAKDADPHVFEYPASASEEVVAEGMKLLELQGFEVERDRYGEARLLAKPKHVPSRAELEALVAPFLERLPQDIANKTAIVYLGPSAKQETINRIASEIGEQGRQVNILKAEDGITLLLHWPDDAAGQSSAFTTPTPSEDSLTTTGAGNTPAILQPGDEVKIEVTGAFPEQPIDGVFVIESQGTVALGATYGRVKIAGLTLLEAEKAVTEKLKTVLTDVQVQITLIKEETPTAYLYDGKTFNEWRRLWKNELNPERRSEAIAAFAAFARAGYGKVAARAILDVAGQYDFSLIDPDAEGKLKERVLDVLTKGASSGVPVGDWMPLLMERLEQDNTKRRPLTEWLLHRLQTSNPSGIADPQTRKLLIEFASNPKFAGDPQFYARYLALALLQQPNADVPLEEDVVRLTKEVLTSDDADKALNLLRLLAFRDLVHYPEQFDLIMHDDPAVRLKVRQYLPHVPGSARGAIAERLLTMLDNPERTTDHADAVRAVGVLRRFAPTVSVRGDWERSDTYKKALDRLSRITEEGPDNLVPVAIVALGIETRERLEGLIKGWKEGSPNFSAERKERATQALDKIEAEAKKVMGEEDSSAGFMRPVGPAGEGFF